MIDEVAARRRGRILLGNLFGCRVQNGRGLSLDGEAKRICTDRNRRERCSRVENASLRPKRAGISVNDFAWCVSPRGNERGVAAGRARTIYSVSNRVKLAAQVPIYGVVIGVRVESEILLRSSHRVILVFS